MGNKLIHMFKMTEAKGYFFIRQNNVYKSTLYLLEGSGLNGFTQVKLIFR